MERHFANIAVRSIGDYKIGGTASVTYNGTPGTEYHLYKTTYERIAPGAFDSVLRSQIETVGLFNHDPNIVLGRYPTTLRMHADASGLHYEIDLDPEIESHRSLYRLISRGDVRGSSFFAEIGYVEWGKDGAKSIRNIRRFKNLWDVSPVTTPAYSGASAVLRSADIDRLEHEREICLAVQSRIERAKNL